MARNQPDDAGAFSCRDEASATILGPQMKLVATEVNVVDFKDIGRWLMEEDGSTTYVSDSRTPEPLSRPSSI